MRKLLFLIPLLLCARSAMAQTTVTAATCNRSDVNAVINGPTHTAGNGDTIQIPAGNCTWTSGVTVPAGIGITIIGAGSPSSSAATFVPAANCQQVVITWSPSGNNAMFVATPNATLAAATMRVSCMDLVPGSGSLGNSANPMSFIGICSTSTCPNLRIDNITGPSSWAGKGLSDDTFAVVTNMFGVADHNQIGDTVPSTAGGVDFINVGHGNWLGVGNWGNNSWATADTFGTNSAFYLENNTFNYGFGTDTDTFISQAGGGRFVCRFNQFNNPGEAGFCANHGTDTGGVLRGGRSWEGYFNTGICGVLSFGGNCGGALFPGRSGVGRSFANSTSVTGSAFWKPSIASSDSQRSWRTDSPWGSCSGQNVWDTNNGGVVASGTLTGATVAGPGYTLTDTGASFPSFTPGATTWVIYDVTVNGAAQIASNTATTLSVVVPDTTHGTLFAATHTYQIYKAPVCMDQPFRGPGLLVSTPTSGLNPVLQSTGNPGAVNEVLDPTYEADDVLPNISPSTLGSIEPSMIPNRDFYVESAHQAAQTSATSPFNGSVGSGHGTLARRPTTCTTGVGYWATDQGTWDTSGGGHQGQLYICTSANTWTLSYIPFTYPHPLITNSPTAGQPTFLPIAGSYATSQSVTINSSNFTVICYNTTGSPATNGTTGCAGGSTLYSTPVSVTVSETLFAVAGGTGFASDSSVGSAAYTIGPPITPSSFNFGSVQNGTMSVSQPFVVLNNTGVTITNVGITFTGGVNYSVASNSCTSTLTNGSSCTVNVQFNPTALGTLTDTLNVNYTGFGGSPFTASLTGIGISAIVPGAPAAKALIASNLKACPVCTQQMQPCLCFTTDQNIYLSTGGAYSLFASLVAPVQSVNGKKGAVTLTVQ